MSVLLDTSVWSVALRRKAGRIAPAEEGVRREWEELVREGRVVTVGPVRQEVLSGIRHAEQFEKLRHQMREFPNIPLRTEHYETAADLSNRCRRKGIAAGSTDALIAAAAHLEEIAVFTVDGDFERLRRFLAFDLHIAR